MTNSRASKGWQVIGNHKSTGTEATHTFTFNAVNFDKHSMLILTLDGETSATLELHIQVNANGDSQYFTDGYHRATGAITEIDIGSEEYWVIADGTLIPNVGKFVGKCEFQINTGATLDAPCMRSEMVSGTSGIHNKLFHLLNVDITTLTSITIKTSTSTWKANTRFTLYKVPR